MVLSPSISEQPVTRRSFLKKSLYGAAGLALYSGEVERHWLEVTRHDFSMPGLPTAFDGMRIAQLGDIHLDEFTEPFFLRHVVEVVNRLRPDAVFLTGDFVTEKIIPGRLTSAAFATGAIRFAIGAAWQCGEMLRGLECRQRYAVLGNHDVGVGDRAVTEALTANGITVLRNAFLPIERGGGRFWLAGLDDPVEGHPDPELAIPRSIRNVPHEPIVLMCHAPDYVDTLLAHPSGNAIALMLSGHTHGGQVRLPLLGALALPPMGKKYIEGWFRLGGLRLYVNRGIGTVGLPFRFLCPPEITLITLRTG
jgi:uncharacterized protein